MFTASMTAAEMSEAYSRLTATATGKGKDSTRKEVKICYVTVCHPPIMFWFCLLKLRVSQKGLEKVQSSSPF